MATAILNYGAFSVTELNSMLTAAKAEYIGRITNGKVKGGGSAAQQYQMDVMTVDELVRLLNGLTGALGLDFADTIRVRPNFNTHGSIPGRSEFGA